MTRETPVKPTLFRCLAVAALASAAGSPLTAQMAAATNPTDVITPDAIYQHLSVIAHDSMMGRDTPSPGLDMTAQYVADQFASFGLEPGGENGTWFQRYPIYRTQLDVENSHVGFMMDGTDRHLSFSADAAHWFGPFPAEEVHGPVVMIGGMLDAGEIKKIDVEGKIVLLVIDMARMRDQQFRVGLFALYSFGPAAVVVVSNRSDTEFASRLARQTKARTVLELSPEDATPIIEVRESALADVASATGLDFATIRGADSLVTQDLPALMIGVDLKQTILEESSAPNTIGILEGSDPTLKNEYVVYSAHMDHVGIRSGQADSISNGADDDASGTVGVMMLAEAFAKAETRPRRSIVFITVSGEEKGLWGSGYFAEHPTVPVHDMVANINIDMIGRNSGKPVTVTPSPAHSKFSTLVQDAAGFAATMGIELTSGDQYYQRSDHYNFARKGVPVVFFCDGEHEDYHKVTDHVDKLDFAKMELVARLAYWTGYATADGKGRPRTLGSQSGW